VRQDLVVTFLARKDNNLRFLVFSRILN